MTDREQKIRQRAYGIWEAEGHPHGRDQDHWHRAAQEVGKEVPAQGDLIPEITDAPSLQPADAASAEKPVARKRKVTAAAVPTSPAPRKRTTKKS
jgi:hypothetical protein